MVRFVRLNRIQLIENTFDIEALLAAPRCFLSAPSPDLSKHLEAHGINTEPIPLEGVPDGSFVILIDGPLYDLVYVTERLLGPNGCPWDQAQTHESLKRYLLEETYEVLDAIDTGSDEKLQEELGDFLLQPLMHAQMKKLAGSFDIDAVADRVVDKLVRRHPHVFGPLAVADAEEVLRNWDRIKKAEKGGEPESILSGVPKGMASLLRAFEVSKRAQRAGFEWPNIDAVFEKLHEEELELKQAIRSEDSSEVESEIGDLLFSAVNLARWVEVEPEEALRKMLNRFTERFQRMESEAHKPFNDLTPEEWHILWEAAKMTRQADAR